MAESIFLSEGEHFVPTEQARGPWDPGALHGGALAALIATTFEQHEPVPGTQVARMGFELLRPIPFAPLTVAVRTVRPGRRVQELAAEVHAEAGERGRERVWPASALRPPGSSSGLAEPSDGASAHAPQAAAQGWDGNGCARAARTRRHGPLRERPARRRGPGRSRLSGARGERALTSARI